MKFKKIILLLVLTTLLSPIAFATKTELDVYYDDKLELFGIENDGDIILSPTYKYMSDFAYGYSIVGNEESFGAINESGKLIIPLKYDKLAFINSTNALALKNKKIGMISKDNVIVHDFVWDSVDMIDSTFLYNTFVFKRDDEYGVSNFNGEILLDNIKSKLSHISDEAVVFSNGDLLGVMDFDKNIIVKEEFDNIYETSNGYLVKKDDTYKFLDKKGHFPNNFSFKHVRKLNDNLYIVSKEYADNSSRYGVYDTKKNKITIPMIYDYISIVKNSYDENEEFISLGINDPNNYYASKEGIAYLNGDVILEARYKDIKFVNENTISYSNDDYNIGLYSTKSKVNTGIMYDGLRNVNSTNNLIVETIDGYYGLLDDKLNYILSPEASYIKKSNNVYIIEKDDTYALYNPLTNKVSDYKYDFINNFSLVADLMIANVKYNGNYGMINENGSFFIAPIYDEIGIFQDGIARISQDGSFGFIKADGSIFIEAKYEMLYIYKNGYAVYKENGKYGYLNKSGNIAIKAQYDSASSFDEDGYATVSLNDKVGIINTRGQYTLKANYADIYTLKDTLVVIEDIKTGLLGIADRSGKIIIDTNCSNIGSFSNYDTTYIKVNSQYALINAKAEIITSFDFDYIGNFNYSFADIEIGEKKGIINTRGEYILE